MTRSSSGILHTEGTNISEPALTRTPARSLTSGYLGRPLKWTCSLGSWSKTIVRIFDFPVGVGLVSVAFAFTGRVCLVLALGGMDCLAQAFASLSSLRCCFSFSFSCFILSYSINLMFSALVRTLILL